MSTIVTRAGKGSALTHNEVDANFVNLNTDKLQSGDTAAALTITSATINGGTITATTVNAALNGTLGATTPSTIDATTISASGVSTFSAGSVSAPAITTTGDTNTGIFFPAADTIAFAENGTESMRIDASGNVGIGITPTYPFQVSRSSTTGGLEVANISLTGTQSADNYADLSFRLGNLGSRGAIVRAITNGGSAGNGHNLAFLTSANGATPEERMRITSIGNVGIGITPSAWQSSVKAIQLTGGSIAGLTTTDFRLYANAYENSGGIYVTTNAATMYRMNSGSHVWYTSPSGTAGTAITWTTAMSLTVGGDLGLSTTDPTGGYAWNSANRVIGAAGDGTASVQSYGALNLINNRATPSSADLFGVVAFTSSNSVAGHTLKAYIAGIADGAGGAAGGFGGKLVFYTKGDNSGAAAQERMRITAAGELLVGITTVVSGGANLQVSDGITFPATAVDSANANTLDDYEEGTFTPVLAGTTLAGTGTYTTQTGNYTKIGRLVYAKIAMTWTAHTGTGNMNITGLPFTPAGSGIGRSAGSMVISNITFGGTYLFAEIADSLASVVPTQVTTGAASSRIPMDSTGTIIISISYQV